MRRRNRVTITARAVAVAIGAVLATVSSTASAAPAGSVITGAPAVAPGVAQPDIVGGTPATVPVAVSLQTPNPDNPSELEHHCGGVLITRRWVLTASHCLLPGRITPEEGAMVRVGSLNHKSGGELIRVKAVFVHPDFVEESFRNDIGLIELAKPATTGYVFPIVRPGKPGTVSRLAGWGITCDLDVTAQGCGDAIPDFLQQLDVRRTDGHQCDDPDPTSGEVDYDPKTMICEVSADGQKRMGCFGDSGSPLLQRLPNGRLAIIATVVGDGDSFSLHEHVCTTSEAGAPGAMIDTNSSSFVWGFLLPTILRAGDPNSAMVIQANLELAG